MANKPCRNGHSTNSYGNCFVRGCPDEHRPSNTTVNVPHNRPAAPPIPPGER
jgi:hypothetical protein